MKIVSEEEVQKALNFLRDNAEELSLAKQRAVKAEHMLKHLEATLFRSSEAGSADARRAEARASERYLSQAIEEAVSHGELAKLYALREAASMLIEAWRSQEATLRSVR